MSQPANSRNSWATQTLRNFAAWVLAFLLGLAPPGAALAQDLVRLAANEDLGAAFDQADRFIDEGGLGRTWVGYSISREMYQNSHLGWMDSRHSYPPLQELLGTQTKVSGNTAILEAARQALARKDQPNPRIQKSVAILFERSGGRTTGLRLVTLDSGFRTEGRPIIWLGPRDSHGSLDFLVRQFRETELEEARAELTNAIGLHDLPERTIPFMERTARAEPGSEVGELARHWLATATVRKLGLYRSDGATSDKDKVMRQALYALVHAREDDSVDLLVKLAKDSNDLELRRQAILQLGNSDEPDAVDALMRLGQS